MMARIHGRVLWSVCAVFAAAFLAVPARGQIDPPPGPVAPSMKRLDQIDPRRTVSSLPGSEEALHVISEPGVYVLTADIVGQPGRHGVMVVCDGDVSLDLNGFSLVGVPGSLHAVYVRDPQSGQSTGRRSFSMPHVFEQKGRISHWGGDGLHLAAIDECAVAGVSISDCGGMACRVSGRHESAMASIRNLRAHSCGGGGVLVHHLPPQAGQIGGGSGKVSLSDLHVLSCGGDGILVLCPTSAVCDVGVERCVVMNCPGDGVCVRGYGAGSGGGAGKVSFQDLSIVRCRNGVCIEGHSGWTGSTCDVARCVVQDCDQDGIRCTDTTLCSLSSFDVSFCGGHGVAALKVVKFKAGADLATTVNKGSSRVHACGGNGLYLLDCPDVSTSGLSVSSCVDGAGILHVFGSNPPDLFTAAHEAAHVVQCRGGIQCDCPNHPMSIDFSCVSCTLSSNFGAGLRLSCPAASPVRCVLDRCVCSSNASSGVELVCHPASSVQCVCSHLRCVHNGGDGISVVSSDPASTLAHGMVMLDSCVCSGNVGSGARCRCPLDGRRCVFSENGSSGVDCAVASPFDAAGSLSDCTLHRNALHGVLCERGKHQVARCDSSDNGQHGMMCAEGCLIVDSCVCNRNGGDGLHVLGTLTVSASAMRRNGGSGAVCSSGQCVCRDCVFELNGTNAGVSAAGAVFLDCTSVSLTRCIASNNTGPGLFCASSAGIACAWSSIDCVCSSNTGDGIRLNNTFGAQVLRCVCTNNGEWGVRFSSGSTGGKIEACSCAGNGGGLFVQGQGNVVISNTCSAGPLGAIIVAGGNALGRVIDVGSLNAGDCDGRANLVH
ncbi:MAG: right-handed parallel beta-helix repeat-containing protein [Phycisphaeraceae bacterium]|nr:right-handed parallel beta-helix repeat-containing protein [Phycisphaeraceae bacterium]